VPAFSIFCTTCKARLKVRDESIVGQILMCPKCGSMVLVEPPAGSSGAASQEQQQTGSGVAAAGAVAPTAAAPAFEDAADLLADEPPVQMPAEPPVQSPVEPPVQSTAPNGATDPLDSEPTPPPVEGAVTTPADDAEQQDDAPQHKAAAAAMMASVVMPGADWTSPRVKLLRQCMLLGGAGVTGIVLAAAVWGFVWSRGASNVSDARPAAPAVADPSPDPISARSEDLPSDPDDAPTPPSPEPPVDDEEPDEDPVKPPEKTDGDPPARPDPPPVDVKPPVEPPPADVEPPTDVKPPKDPPAVDPPKDPSPVDPPDDDRARPTEIPPKKPVDDRPPLPTVDVAARLKDRLPAIEYRDIALSDFLQEMTAFTTIPMTLDPDAVAPLGVGANAPVAVRAKDTTVGKMIAEALASKRLAYRAEDRHLTVIRAPYREGEFRVVPYVVTDLAGDEPGALTRLGKTTQTLVEPDSWRAEGVKVEMNLAERTLSIAQSEDVQYKLFMHFEKLRTARGRSLQSTLNPALFQLDTRWKRAEKTLANPVTMNFNRPTSLVAILARLKKATGVTFLVDWRSAAAARVAPDAKATLVADKQPLSEALKTLLGPMGLTFRAVDETTLQITTPYALAAQQEVEFYPVGDLLTGSVDDAALVERIRTKLGAALFPPGGEGVIHFDAPSKCLIVRLSQPQQRKVEQFLADCRATK